MHKIIKVINSPWLYISGLVVSFLALYGCILDGAPGYGMLLCGLCIGAYVVLTLFSSTEGKLIDG